jgi:hypothetical protein
MSKESTDIPTDATEIVGGAYPEGFIEWNQKLGEVLLEGLDTFNPELVLGALETLKMVYIDMAINKTKK